MECGVKNNRLLRLQDLGNVLPGVTVRAYPDSSLSLKSMFGKRVLSGESLDFLLVRLKPGFLRV
jgi:hypothetical protein